MYRCVVAVWLYPASAVSARTLTPLSASVAPVLLREIVHREMDALELPPRHRQVARLLGAHGETHGVEFLPELLATDIFPNGRASFEDDAFNGHLLQPAVDRVFFHLEIWDAVAE